MLLMLDTAKYCLLHTQLKLYLHTYICVYEHDSPFAYKRVHMHLKRYYDAIVLNYLQVLKNSQMSI